MTSNANVKQLEADVVVIGGGAAGLPAALTALDNGAKKIIVVEKRFAPGGDGLRCNHIFAVGSHLQKEAGSTLTADQIYKQALEWHHYDRVNPRILRALINKTADDIHWFESKGAEFKLLAMGPDKSNATTHVVKDFPEPDSLCTIGALLRLIFKRCKEGGIQFLFHTSGKKIIRGASGEVTGVIAADNKGNEYNIITKAVILSPGSFLGNRELMYKYFPNYYNDEVHHDALSSNTGDGIPIAADAGALLTDFCTLIRHGNDSFDRESMYMPTGASGGAAAIQVNTLGQRFIDEGTRVIGGNILAQQPGKIGYSIYDQKAFDSFSTSSMFGMTKQARIPIPPEKRLKLKPFLEQKNKEGKWVKIADNWDDIANWIGCDPEALKETIERYNSFCDKGYDEDFVKDPKFLMPLRTPPYYAVKFRPLVIESVGPVVVNERMEVLDKNNPTVPIPGFFSAGVINVGWMSNDYGGTPGGSALGLSIAMGRIAAESAAKYVLSK